MEGRLGLRPDGGRAVADGIGEIGGLGRCNINRKGGRENVDETKYILPY